MSSMKDALIKLVLSQKKPKRETKRAHWGKSQKKCSASGTTELL